MPGKRITDHQVHKYKQHRNKLSQLASATKADTDDRQQTLQSGPSRGSVDGLKKLTSDIRLSEMLAPNLPLALAARSESVATTATGAARASPR